MADFNFTASARVPTRPLSYENKDIAEPKELIADYINHELYIKDTDGNIVNVTASVSTVVQEVITQIKEDPSFIVDTTIELPSGESVTIDNAIIDALTQIEELQESLGLIKDETGNITLKIQASDVVTSDDKQFVSKEEKEAWNAKTDTIQLTMSIAAGEDSWTTDNGEAPYKQTINNTTIKESDYPVVDVKLSDVYATAMEELNNYAHIYKILTFDGYIEVYAVKPTEVALSIIMKIDR